jgi:hypothetical protein
MACKERKRRRGRADDTGEAPMDTPVTNAETAASARTDWAAVTEQWLRAYKAGLDTMLALANATLMGVERMEMAQLAADVEAQTQNRKAALAVADCRDVNGLLGLQTSLATAYLDSSMRYWSAVAELVQQTSAEVTRILSGRADQWLSAWQRGAGGDATPLREAAAVGFAKPLLDAFEAARASQEAMLRSLASFAPGLGRERAAA